MLNTGVHFPRMQLAKTLTQPLRALNLGEKNIIRSVLVPLLVAGVALAVAIVGALIVGGGEGGFDTINFFVDGTLSGNSQRFLRGFISATSLYTLTLGMTSAVNPCGFAMLPAYLGMYLRDGADVEPNLHPARNLGKALLIGGTVTAGLVLLFGVAGGLIGVGASFVRDLLPWLGLVIGFGLAIVGACMVGGGKLYTGLAARAASHMGNPSQVNFRGYFMFGLSYGTASLSCTLGLVLVAVGLSVTDLEDGIDALSVLGNLALFGLGMGLVIMALTLGMAFFKGAMVGLVRKALPFFQPFGSWLMVIAGAYIVFYWLTIGGLL